MTEQRQGQRSGQAWETLRRRAGIAAFLAGLVAALAVFALLPGLPHVIDWGAVLVSLAAGGLARWACQSWMTRKAERKTEHM
ncbi:hypothetical protein [Streptomyces melanogenes]|uniref:Uncharacterized protein n=1 Tax=Streptomyces melanogenes TaxID=67326 RepID=A0ABZ1XR11_9ACTN|nr:hypothetical protein [Streptomyces melanogenes]